jgi:uncharacterized glyoxalase superfamily protein PhnB
MKRSVRAIPEGYHTVTNYLTVEGVGRLLDFLKRGLGAEQRGPIHHGPDGRIMHAEVKIGDTIIMMGEPMGHGQARPSTLYLYVEDVDAVYRRAVDAGGKSKSEPKDMFYGDRSGAIEDPSGNAWFIGTHIEDVSEEEMQRRIAKMGGAH